jgi:hypothetical protein
VTDRSPAAEPDGESGLSRRHEAAGCMAGAFGMSFFAAVILLLVPPEPHGWLQLVAGVPLAVLSVPAWGAALLLRARITGSRPARIAAYALLAAGAVLVAGLVWAIAELF